MGGWKPRRLLGVKERAPDFSLPELGGGNFDLRQALTRGPVLLGFFKVDCPVCQFTFPFLERLHQAGGGRIQFYGVSQDGARASEDFNRSYKVSFPTLLDDSRGGYPVSNAFGISVVPTLFLIEPDGAVSWLMESFSKSDLEALGARLGAVPFLPGERVPDYRPG